MIRVVIADDQELVREGLATMVAAADDIDVVGMAADGVEAVDLVRSLRPDVVLMDVRMPRLDGLEATRRLLTDPRVTTRVVVLTTFDVDEYVLAALGEGASGFLLKDLPKAMLIESVRAVAAGEMTLAPSVTRRIVERQGWGRNAEQMSALDRLTGRERDVLERVAAGASNAEIAAALHLSLSTVKTHVGSLLQKLGARDRVQLVILSYQTGLAR